MSNRKPYRREMRRSWWLDKTYYLLYMLREATVVPLAIFTIFLTIGLAALVKGEASWQTWLNFMANPIVIVINIFALIASFYHAYTFFDMMTTVMPIKLKGKTLDKRIYLLLQWGAALGATVIMLAIALWC